MDVTNPYDPLTGKWLAPLAWSPAVMPGGAGDAGGDPLSAALAALGQSTGGDGGKGATNLGFNGQVQNFGDFAKATLGGLGAVFGGPLAGPAAIAAMAMSGGKSMSPAKVAFDTIKDLLGIGGSDGGLSGGQIEVNPGAGAGGFGAGAMSGLAGGIGGLSGALGNITGGAVNTMSGGSEVEGPEPGGNHETGHGYAGGGYVTTDRLHDEPPEYQNILAAYLNAPPDAESTARYRAAHDAIASSVYNSVGPERQANYRARLEAKGLPPGRMETGRDIEHARASYPGFAAGGHVTPGSLAGPNPPGPDTGYAALKPGEFVLSAPATQAIGPDVLTALNAMLSGRGAPFGFGRGSPQEIRPGEDWTAMIDRIRPKQGNTDPRMVIKPRDPRDTAADTPLYALPTDSWGRNQMPDRGIWQ